MKRQFIFIVLAALFGLPLAMRAQEAYVVLSDDNKTLTFYYDNNKESRGGLDLSVFRRYEWEEEWEEDLEIGFIESAVFDASFANYTELTSTDYWFSGFGYLSSITGLEYLNTEHVTNMEGMFSFCPSLTTLDLSSFNTGNVKNMEGMFSNCSRLASLDLSSFNTESVTNMGYMFFDCSRLTSLDLSSFKTENVTDMRAMFCGCLRLTSLDLSNFNTEKVIHMGSCEDGYMGMFSFCSSLTSLDLSSFNTGNVTVMSGMFSGCSSLTSLDLSSFNTVNVMAMDEMFCGCSRLKTIYAGIEWSTTNVLEGELFYECTSLVGGAGTTYDEDHIDLTYARIDGGESAPGYFTEIVGNSLSLQVLTPEGSDAVNHASIIWYDADGQEIGLGSTLGGVEEGTDVYYSVLLDEAFGRIYREVTMQKANGGEGNTIVCLLEEIGQLTLQGRVSAPDIDKTTVTVNIKQMLNGKWEQSYSTQTNEQGVFQVEVYDDQTEITLIGDGYFDVTLRRDGLNGNGNVGTIPMSLITGFALAANVTLKMAAAVGSVAETTPWADELNNIEFALTNKSTDEAITDFTVQNGSVIIKSGASVGDEIGMGAKSKQGIFADAATTFTLQEGANSFDLQLTELGGVDATCTASSNATTVGYLYDHNDQLAARGSYRGETLSLRHLKSGTYTLVSMGQSLLLGSMTSLNDLKAVGLSEGTNYVTTRIEVADGELTAVAISDVPRLDETPFYYTTGNTYFNAGKTSVTAGTYITLQAHMDFKPEHADIVDGVTLTVDLPEGCRMVENSVIANRQAVPHIVSGNRVTMTLSKEQYESEVRFCVIPTLNQSYTVTAMATFDIGGQVQQPIGTAQFEAKGLSLNAPKLAANTTVTINGTAKGHSQVSIYDNDVLVGTVTSKADGSWTAQCELYKPYSPSFHDIHAKITTDDGMVLTSETKQVEYEKTYDMPSSVMMTYYNSWYRKNIDVTFDLQNGTATPSSYPFYTATDFTFLADFTRKDSTVVRNVSIKVLNSDGTVRTLPATFDGSQGKWVATTRYSSASRLPQNVTVEYDLIPSEISDEEREEALQEQANALASSASVIGDFFDNKTEMTLVGEGEDYALFECRTSPDVAPIYYRIENMDYQVADDMMKEKQFVYTEGEDNIIGTFTESADGSVTVYVVDVLNSAACKMSLYENTASGARANGSNKETIEAAIRALKESVYSGRFLAGLLEQFGNLVDLLTGIKEYWSVRGDFDNMCNVILNYSDNLEQVNKKTFDMTLAKCADGSYRLSKEDMDKYYKAIQAISNSENTFIEKYYLCLEQYKAKLGLSVMTFVGTLGLGKAIGALGESKKFLKSPLNKWFYNTLNKHFSSYVFRTTSANILSSVIGTAVGWVIGKIDNIFSYKDFNDVKDRTLSWASTEYSGYLKNYADLKKAIRRDYKKCGKDDDEKQDEPLDNSSGNNPDFLGKGTTPVIDPSGFVYEAVLSNRLEGVTTTCYEQQGGSAVLWNAEDYSQQNPLKTDATGFYRWDVPQGMWQVKYEKEGYETAYSEWLPVPPPQLDVNIGMKQSTPPTVTQMRGYESGITIDMSKYMLPATMNTTNITVTRNSTAVSGSIELLNAEQAPLGGETYVQKVKFVPQSRFNTTDQVVVTVHQEVESYCGTKMTKDYVETVKIEPEIKSIVCDSVVTVNYQDTRDVQVLVLPKEASAGRKLHVMTSSAMIASVSSDEVIIDQNGLAVLALGGELPGGAVLDFSVDNTDVTATTKVKVVMGRDMVAMPVANIQSGSLIEGGTQIVLTCATKGATIYYTLDGSCPCDETTRYKYDGPFTVATNVVVKAIAVKEGMDDSDIATFIYMVNGIKDTKGGKDLAVNYQDGLLTVTGVGGGSVRVFDLQGRELAYRRSFAHSVTVHVPQAESYIVSVTLSNGQTVVRKVTGR